MSVAARSDLARRLDSLCEPLPFHTGWYLKDLVTGEDADRNTKDVPPELADGTPGFAAAARLIGALTRTCFDALT